ncbi:hypothetical protein J5N97_023054 [Dioscorea zingiberensis]|uniref:Mediator complex subunit Med12 domain-containing protein n=1 Tax=Dioscorea zingiberensis TaxID=325984 RepID=A0A9D5CBL2_9LILI|nr:hypothetical protein J5N97_023054 [Dioscorea zingiberensis]
MVRHKSCAAGGVNNSAINGTPTRDPTRVESSFSSSNIPRRTSFLTPYKLKCDRESLSCRLGPPDFYPQTPNCPEETLTREYLQSGYKETVEGIEEAREIQLNHVATFVKPEFILKCKEAIRKRLRAIIESRAQKRKAGQVYGVPLSGPLLTKSGVFPDQKACGEDFRRKWIEGLAQQHKQLRSLSENIPHGYRKKALFEVLIRHNVPLLRATWFIKVNYLNQFRHAVTSVSSGAPDKAQFARADLWTKDVIEYLQLLVDEFFSKDGAFAALPPRDQSSPNMLAGVPQHRSDSVSATLEVDEPSLQFKWSYMVHLLHWHFAEGLLLPSLVVEWVLGQLQERESADALELLLPIIYVLVERIALSQTYARIFIDIVVRVINALSPSGSGLTDNSSKPSLVSTLIEMLRWFIFAIPDTFVALDCFPLPNCVAPDLFARNNSMKVENVDFGNRAYDHRYWSFGSVVSSIQKRSANLAKIVNPGVQGYGMAKALQALDKALIEGDLRIAYNSLFGDFSDMTIEEAWIAEVSPCLRSSLKWIGGWATCDYRDCRTALPPSPRFTGGKDFCQIYVAVSLLKLKMEYLHCSSQFESSSPIVVGNSGKAASLHDSLSGGTIVENVTGVESYSKGLGSRKNRVDLFQSPGPLHDIIVCWLDQHEAGKGEGFKRLLVFIMELVRNGIFYPQAYVRQLIISGVMDRDESQFDLERQKRHYQILKQLPGSCMFDVMEEARITKVPLLKEAVNVYSNERRLVLQGYLGGKSTQLKAGNGIRLNVSSQKPKDHSAVFRDGPSPSLLESHRNFNLLLSPVCANHEKSKVKIAELKVAISSLLHIPSPCSPSPETRPDESQRSNKRSLGSLSFKSDVIDRQKLDDERSSPLHGCSSNWLDDEDIWWIRKGPKPQEAFKVEPSLKSSKPASRGRRKTQSLAQLAANRIESSHGASTSHVCENKVSCPHHKSALGGEIPNDTDRMKIASLSDISRTLKQLRMLEKRSISVWLVTSVRQLVEGNEKTASKAGHYTSAFSSSLDDRNTKRWRLSEDELSTILYLLDISMDLTAAIGSSSNVHIGRNVMMPTKSKESTICDVGEAFLLSSLQRYENVLVSSDLLPEVLTAAIHRAMTMLTANGRSHGSAAFSYSRNLLKKYRDIGSVTKWEKNFRTTCDQRMLTELDAIRTADSSMGFSPGVPAGVDDSDEYLRKLSGRMSRFGGTMKELVQRRIEDAVQYFYGKERKPFAAAVTKNPSEIMCDDGYQIAQEIFFSLLDCICQNGGASQEWDPTGVASAVSAIVGNVGLAVAKTLDLSASNNYQTFSSSASSLNCARHILRIHILSLCLLKESLGERLGRVFDIALASEASSAVSGAFSPGKPSRSHFQPSPENHDGSLNHPNENLNNSSKTFVGRTAKAAASVSALVVGAIVHGVVSLERMVAVFKLKEGLDVQLFIRSARSSSNGMSRSFGTFKIDHCIEVSVHWFRVLIGNCRTVFDGLVADILGEPYTSALSRMQRMLPLNLVFPPAYSMFGMVIWRPYILNSNIATREDIQLYQHLSMAVGDAIKHQPFRDLCLRNTHVLYDLLASDVGDSEFAAMLEMHSPDKHLKTIAFVPLRARLFLNALVDCQMPPFTLMKEDGSWVSGPSEPRAYAENETKLLDQLVHVLDTLQPAKFHWQWVELRLLLNEQALIEKIETQNMLLVEAIKSLSPKAENFSLSENERNFIEIVLTRLLVRPDAASLYSEVVNLLGKSLEESLLQNTKWFLAGNDVLLGRKSIRQRLANVAQLRGLSTKAQFWKPWGWSCSNADVLADKSDKRKMEVASIEEGEVVDEGVDIKRPGRMSFQLFDAEGFSPGQQYITDRALAELVLPCIDRSSSDSRNSFATELIKQLNTIEQQINMLTRSGGKQSGSASSAVEVSSSKSSSRKGLRGGSPGLGRRPTSVTESSPPSAAALRASMWLRLQFLLRLLPIICADREQSTRNMRHTLAAVILRLLGTRVVQEDADACHLITHKTPRREEEYIVNAPITASLDLSGDSLFDRFLCVLHGLLGNFKPSWLKAKSISKSTVKSRDFSVVDREVVEKLQVELDRMELPAAIRRRLQAAMPVLPPSPPLTISCNPPLLTSTALTSLQPGISSAGLHQANSIPNQRTSIPSARPATTIPGKGRASLSQDLDVEIDPWTLLEDGSGTASAPSNSSSNVGGSGADYSNLKACSWLKGAVRVRRTDLTYIGAMDDDN